jgi:hypothetical protein
LRTALAHQFSMTVFVRLRNDTAGFLPWPHHVAQSNLPQSLWPRDPAFAVFSTDSGCSPLWRTASYFCTASIGKMWAVVIRCSVK